MIVIEEMTEEDVEQASELESRSFSMPWRAEDFLEMVKADYAHYFVAKEEGKIIGCCGLRDISGEGEITNVVVDSDCRGRGIGRALVEKMAVYVRDELGKSRMTVNASPFGVPFYHKIGFRNLGEERQRDGILYTPMEYLIENRKAW